MELFHCVSDQQRNPYRARSEEKDGNNFATTRQRRQSLPVTAAARPVRRSNSSISVSNAAGAAGGGSWSKHYEQKKTGTGSPSSLIDPLTSRTLSPPPDTLPRKYSRSSSVLSNHSTCSRLARHPELPPLTTETTAPRLKDYLDKPRLVSTAGRRPSKVMTDVDELIPGLSKLTSYYNQTFLNVCDTCDSLNHTNPVSVLNATQSNWINRGM